MPFVPGSFLLAMASRLQDCALNPFRCPWVWKQFCEVLAMKTHHLEANPSECEIILVTETGDR